MYLGENEARPYIIFFLVFLSISTLLSLFLIIVSWQTRKNQFVFHISIIVFLSCIIILGGYAGRDPFMKERLTGPYCKTQGMLLNYFMVSIHALLFSAMTEHWMRIVHFQGLVTSPKEERMTSSSNRSSGASNSGASNSGASNSGASNSGASNSAARCSSRSNTSNRSIITTTRTSRDFKDVRTKSFQSRIRSGSKDRANESSNRSSSSIRSSSSSSSNRDAVEGFEENNPVGSNGVDISVSCRNQSSSSSSSSHGHVNRILANFRSTWRRLKALKLPWTYVFMSYGIPVLPVCLLLYLELRSMPVTGKRPISATLHNLYCFPQHRLWSSICFGIFGMIFGLPGFYFCARIYDRMLKQRRFNLQFGTTFISFGYLSWWMFMMIMYLTATLISFVPTLVVSIFNAMSYSWKGNRAVHGLLLLTEFLPALMGILIFLMFGFGNNAQIVYRRWKESFTSSRLSSINEHEKYEKYEEDEEDEKDEEDDKDEEDEKNVIEKEKNVDVVIDIQS